MTKEELIQKEIARILEENPENTVAALRAKRKQTLAPIQVKTGKKTETTILVNVDLAVSKGGQ